MSISVNTNGGFCFKVPNSYQKAVAIEHRDNISSQKNVSNNLGKNGQYRFVYQGAGNKQMLNGSGSVVNILGKTMVSSSAVSKLPVGVYVKIKAKRK